MSNVILRFFGRMSGRRKAIADEEKLDLDLMAKSAAVYRDEAGEVHYIPHSVKELEGSHTMTNGEWRRLCKNTFENFDAACIQHGLQRPVKPEWMK